VSSSSLPFAENDPAASRGAEPSAPEVLEHLAKAMASSQLANAQRLSSLLRFVVVETLAGRGSRLKEAGIGLQVFGRQVSSYDPAIDPIVRVQMGRLRSKLRSYYEGEGSGEAVRIEVPIGAYVPTFVRRTVETPATEQPLRIPSAPVDDLRIAVLPMTNTSGDPENQYFCDGLTEELINRFAQFRQLRVVARTSSFQFRDAARDVREVGRLLDVSAVLEGSVLKAGHRIRVTVQFINVADGCHIWSDRYEGEITDLFAIHERISSAICCALQKQMFATEHKPAIRPAPAAALKAYNHYLQGRFLWKKRTEQGLRAALDHFDRAVQIEPTLARALSGIADCYVMLGLSAAEGPDQCMPKAAEAATRALRLDDSLAEAHASLAAVKNCYEWDLPGAERGYHKALSLDSSYATALHWLGVLIHGTLGRLGPAVECLEQAIDLDPLSPPIIADLALVRAFAEDFDATAMYCRRALELDPHFHRPFWFLGLSSAWSGRFQAAEEALQHGLALCQGDAFRSRLLGALGFVYGRSGKALLAREVKRDLDRMRQTSYVPSFELAQIEVGLGNLSGALACLEDAVVTHESFAVFMKSWLSFRPLRGEQRFQALLASTGRARLLMLR
jgi:TolB-like protein/Flp pilus assembly protein TadD